MTATGTPESAAAIGRGEEAVWFDALGQGRLTFTRCRSCLGAWLPIRPLCPRCWSADVCVEDSGGLGTIYSFTVQRRSSDPLVSLPNVVVLVDLDEGFRMLSRLEGDSGDVRIGMRVQADLQLTADGRGVPPFRSVAGGAAR